MYLCLLDTMPPVYTCHLYPTIYPAILTAQIDTTSHDICDWKQDRLGNNLQGLIHCLIVGCMVEQNRSNFQSSHTLSHCVINLHCKKFCCITGIQCDLMRKHLHVHGPEFRFV